MLPYGIEWLDEARADVRSLDRQSAMRIFDGILNDARAGGGDMTGSFRLQVGHYRVLFTFEQNTIRIFGVRHRSEAYR